MNIYKKNSMIILKYLSRITNDLNNSTVSGISKGTEISIGSASQTLIELKKLEIITSTTIGRAKIYKIINNNPIIKSFKIFNNILDLNNLTNNIKSLSKKIILFGSCSRGEDDINSDIDLFILAEEDNIDTIRNIVSDYNIDRTINLVLIDSFELSEMTNNDKIFLEQIENGFVLWEVN